MSAAEAQTRVRRPWLQPLVPLYRVGLWWKNRRFDHNRIVAPGQHITHKQAMHPSPGPARELRDPVVSVGGLSAGGSGKTPFLIALAGLVRELGYAPDVLSRGYGRDSRGVLRVDARGRAADYGDEPLLLARALGCPVYVGGERYKAGLLAERELPHSHRGMHLLDDGFQHRRLARTVDVVLLTAEDARDALLPAGNLRESLSALRRADVVVLRASEAAALRPVAERVLARAARPVRVWVVERSMTLPASLPEKPMIFSGIARPADFERTLQDRGIAVAGARRFRDHHRYTSADVEALAREARSCGADGLITTAKDAVKLDEAMLRTLREVGRVAVADAVVTLQDRERCAEELRQLLRERNKLARHIVGPGRDGVQGPGSMRA